MALDFRDDGNFSGGSGSALDSGELTITAIEKNQKSVFQADSLRKKTALNIRLAIKQYGEDVMREIGVIPPQEFWRLLNDHETESDSPSPSSDTIWPKSDQAMIHCDGIIG